jgi:hypothetical protein
MTLGSMSNNSRGSMARFLTNLRFPKIQRDFPVVSGKSICIGMQGIADRGRALPVIMLLSS